MEVLDGGAEGGEEGLFGGGVGDGGVAAVAAEGEFVGGGDVGEVAVGFFGDDEVAAEGLFAELAAEVSEGFAGESGDDGVAELEDEEGPVEGVVRLFRRGRGRTKRLWRLKPM